MLIAALNIHMTPAPDVYDQLAATRAVLHMAKQALEACQTPLHKMGRRQEHHMVTQVLRQMEQLKRQQHEP